MKSNSWPRLPTPKAHPLTRSSSPWMPYPPHAGVGILWGCSHAGYHNDLWTYDLTRNAWTEMLPTEPSAARDPGVLKIKDGVLMTCQERPLSFHQWGGLDYDIHRRVPWWTIVYTQDPEHCVRHIGCIRYFPPTRRLIMAPRCVCPNEARQNFKTYDPDSNTWQPLKITWKPLDRDISPYWIYGRAPIVYDARRKVLVLILGNGGTWLLDPIKRTMVQNRVQDEEPAQQPGWPRGGVRVRLGQRHYPRPPCGLQDLWCRPATEGPRFPHR